MVSEPDAPRDEELRKDAERYRAMVAAFDGLIYVCSPDYRIEFVNQRLIERSGHNPVGEKCYKALHDRDSICPWCINQRVFAGETVRWELQSPRDGRWYAVVSMPLRHPDGTVSKQSLISDITRSKQIEQALQESEQKYRSLFERNPDGIFALDASGHITVANPACQTISGYSVQELVGKSFAELCAPDQLEKTIHKISRTLAGEPPENLRTALIHKDGRRVELLVTGGPVVLDGKVVAIHCAAKDITEQEHAEEALRESRDRLALANRAKDEFLAVLSHELRTPLSPVLATAQLMEMDQKLSAEQLDSVEMIRRNVELETRLIDDLLDLTRISRGKVELHLQPVDLHRQVEQVVAMCQSDTQGKQLKLTVELQALRPWVQGDPARLQQVLWNLLKNAVKFTPAGGQITIGTTNPTPACIAITVRDTGAGIEPEALPRIFTAFEQGGQAVTRQFGGLGLGLAISKGLMDLHGGTLTATSEGKGKGATFRLLLPTLAAGAEKAARGGGGRREPAFSGAGRRILLVEDHADTARVMAHLLARYGFEVRTAASVAEALQAAAAGKFDLLISDLGLPDGSGHDLMRQLAARHAIKGIAVSGFGMDDDIRKSEEAGFAAHITKPVNLLQFQEAIRQLL